MNLGLYGLVIVFGAFIILLIINPNLSCFGKRLKSPFYPLLRKRKASLSKFGQRTQAGGGQGQSDGSGGPKKPGKATEDYGFHLDE